MRRFTTTKQVIAAFGGSKKFAEKMRTTPQAVNNWRRGKFPASIYLILLAEADIAGIVVPDNLFTMRTRVRKRR